MGFTDTMKGLGRALGGVLQTGIETFGPPLMQAGATALMGKITGGGGGGYQYYSAPGAGYLPTPTRMPAPTTPSYLPYGAIQRSVPQNWTPLGAAPQPTPRATPAPAYGYQPAVYPSVAGALGALGGYLWGQNGGNGGMPAFPSVVTDPGTTGGGLGGEIMERLRGVVGGQTTMFRYGGQRVSPVREIQALHPETGRICTWKYMGRPILYSGDLAACRRVSRVARRVARRRPR